MQDDTVRATTSVRAGLLGPLAWRKSEAGNPCGDCVELARIAEGDVAVRNSRDPHGPALLYTPAEFAAFLTGVKAAEFDDLGGLRRSPAAYDRSLSAESR